MSNTYTDLFVDAITDKVIGALRKKLPTLRVMSTDVSPQAVGESEKAKTINVPLVAAPAANDFTGDYTANADTVDSTVPVTTDQHKVATFHLSDIEAMDISAGVWAAAALEKVTGAVYNVADAIINYALTKVLAASFTASKVVAPADFDGSELGVQATFADTNGFSEMSRSVLLPSTYLETLVNDPSLQAYYAQAEQQAVRDNVLPRLKGFQIAKYNNIPANGENLAALVMDPRGLAVAVRPVLSNEQARQYFISQQVITDEDSGLSVTYTIWFDLRTRKTYHNIEARYGAAAGRGTAIRRIKSA
jgi:hypothetical protein